MEQDKKIKRSWYFNLILGAGIPMLTGLIMLTPHFASPGSGFMDYENFTGNRTMLAYLFILLILIGLVRLPYSLIFSLAGKNKEAFRPKVYGSLLVLLIPVLVFYTDNHLMNRGVMRTTEQAEPIISALEKYRKANGGYPEELGQLTPKFLPEIPSPASSLIPPYGYSFSPETGQYRMGFRRYGFGLHFSNVVYSPEAPCDEDTVQNNCPAPKCTCRGKWRESVIE